MYCYLYVKPQAAVLAGKSQSGRVTLDITEAFLASLTQEERVELTSLFLWSDPRVRPETGLTGQVAGEWFAATNGSSYVGVPDIADASLEGLRQALRDRIDVRKRAAQARTQELKESIDKRRAVLTRILQEHTDIESWLVSTPTSSYYEGWELHSNVKNVTTDPLHPDDPVVQQYKKRVAAVNELLLQRRAEWCAAQAEVRRQAEEEALQRQAKEAALQAQQQAARQALILKIGKPNQVERYTAGVLPESEANQIVSDHVFESMLNMPRYTRLSRNDTKHIAENENHEDHELKFDVVTLKEMTAVQWRHLRSIKDRAPTDARLEARVHSCWCADDACGDAEVTVRHSVLVTVNWHGKDFSREYMLPDV